MNCKHGLLKIVFLSLLALTSAAANAAKNPDPFEMSEQMDAIDKQDFQAAIERATSCIHGRNFTCAETELAKAAKATSSGQDKKMLLAIRQNMANEKQQLANEIRQAEEARKAELERREARFQEQQEAAERLARRQARESDDDDDAAPIDDWRAKDTAFWNNVRQQDNARLAEAYRKRDEQRAEQARQRAESNERAAEQRRDAQRDRNARVAQADTDRQLSQQRQQAEQDRARDRELIRQKQAKEEADRLVVEQNRAREQESNRQRQDKEKADGLAAQEAVRVAQVVGTMSSPSASTAQRYMCTHRKDFWGAYKGTDPGAYEMSCVDAIDQANKFIASFNVSTPWNTAGNRKPINVEACKKSTAAEYRATVWVNYSESEPNPCGPSRGISR